MTDGMDQVRPDSDFMCGSSTSRGPEFRFGVGLSLSGVQIASRASASSLGMALDLRGDAVECLAQSQVVAQRLEAAALAQRGLLVGVGRRTPLLPRAQSDSTSESGTSIPSGSAQRRARARRRRSASPSTQPLEEIVGGLPRSSQVGPRAGRRATRPAARSARKSSRVTRLDERAGASTFEGGV